MLFNSVAFLIFFPIVTTIYFLLSPPSPQRLGYRWILLLIASSIFYMYFIPKYIFVMLYLIVVDYFAAIKIEEAPPEKKNRYLITSILSTISILFVFKYFNFFNSNVQLIADKFGFDYPIETLNLILPLGLSFHTFQSLSYVTEVYMGRQKAERHIGLFALYVMFYPQLCAGPIERPQNLLPQFREKLIFNYGQVTNGLKRMAWGLFKKVIIADHLGPIVNHIYGSPANSEGPFLVLATIVFAFQMYSDFSGYTDIAIGSAEVMGFRLRPNFIRPYFSKSIQEYWRRWHISLSSWFRDYVYIPLGGKNCSKSRWYFNLLITFIGSGLWHGANWTYVTWGLINGFYLLFGYWTRDIRATLIENPLKSVSPFLLKVFQVLVTFSLVCIGRIFTRSATISDAWYIFSHLLSGWSQSFNLILSGNFYAPDIFFGHLGVSLNQFIICCLLIGMMISVDLLQRTGSVRMKLKSAPIPVRWAVYVFLSYSVLWSLILEEAPYKEFIYFQF